MMTTTNIGGGAFWKVPLPGLGWKLGVATLVSRGLGSSLCSAPTSGGPLGRRFPQARPRLSCLQNAALALPPLTLCNSMTVGCQS